MQNKRHNAKGGDVGTSSVREGLRETILPHTRDERRGGLKESRGALTPSKGTLIAARKAML